jgi:hypothetical protein
MLLSDFSGMASCEEARGQDLAGSYRWKEELRLATGEQVRS